jgi:tetratricopeptide (TPR) repeat protein
LVVLGKALSTLSKQSGKGQPGEEALARLVDYLQQELKEYGSEGDPCKLGIIKSNLGDIQWSLGEREGSAARSAARLEKGVDFYREASKEWARAREPQERARTQRTLGIALRKLGERERGAARLEEAVTVCREALKVLTRERFPLEWAQTQYHLGMALMRLGERVGDTIRLEEAVAAFKAALEVFEAEEETEFIKLTQDSLSRVEKLLRERRK